MINQVYIYNIDYTYYEDVEMSEGVARKLSFMSDKELTPYEYHVEAGRALGEFIKTQPNWDWDCYICHGVTRDS